MENDDNDDEERHGLIDDRYLDGMKELWDMDLLRKEVVQKYDLLFESIRFNVHTYSTTIKDFGI